MTPANDTFNYLAVLFSTILGLAFAELLQGVRRLLRARSRVTLYAPAVIWPCALLLILAQEWWAMFGLRSHVQWTFAMYAAVLLQTVISYLIAGLALPEPERGEAIDMRVAYYAHARPFFLLMVAAALASIAKDIVIDGRPPHGGNLAFHVGFAASAALAAFTRASWYHQLLAPTVGLLFCVYVVALFSRL